MVNSFESVCIFLLYSYFLFCTPHSLPACMFCLFPKCMQFCFCRRCTCDEPWRVFQRHGQWYHSDIWRPRANVFSEVLKWHWVTHTLAFFKWKREEKNEGGHGKSRKQAFSWVKHSHGLTLPWQWNPTLCYQHIHATGLTHGPSQISLPLEAADHEK